MKEHRIPITCIHDTFNLICPICGNVWYNDTKIKDLVECTRCGIEIELTRNGNACRLTMILQGARCTAQNSLYMMLSAMIHPWPDDILLCPECAKRYHYEHRAAKQPKTQTTLT